MYIFILHCIYLYVCVCILYILTLTSSDIHPFNVVELRFHPRLQLAT